MFMNPNILVSFLQEQSNASATVLYTSAPAGPTKGRRVAQAKNYQTLCSGGCSNRISFVPCFPNTDRAGQQAPHTIQPADVG